MKGRTSLLDAMRVASASTHRRLETRLALLDPALSWTRYRAVLEGMWGYHSPLEAHLEAAGAWSVLGVDAHARRRAHHLAEDLRALGRSATDLERLPRCTDLPDVTEAASAVGCLYVVEGSTLGGRVIHRHLREALGPEVDAAARFFAGHGERTGRLWQQTCEAIGAFDGRGDGFAKEAAASAVRTFESLEGWLENGGVLHAP